MTPDELKAQRKQLGLGQAELARMLGVPRQHVYRWESGAFKVPPLMPMALRGVQATLNEKPRRRRRRRSPASTNEEATVS